MANKKSYITTEWHTNIRNILDSLNYLTKSIKTLNGHVSFKDSGVIGSICYNEELDQYVFIPGNQDDEA